MCHTSILSSIKKSMHSQDIFIITCISSRIMLKMSSIINFWFYRQIDWIISQVCINLAGEKFKDRVDVSFIDLRFAWFKQTDRIFRSRFHSQFDLSEPFEPDIFYCKIWSKPVCFSEAYFALIILVHLFLIFKHFTPYFYSFLTILLKFIWIFITF